MFPQSIPSPSEDWQVLLTIPFGWLNSILPFVSPTAAVEVRTYAVCIIVGIVAAVLMANRRLTARGAEPWIVIDIAVWAVLLGLVGSRLYHVVTHPNDYFYAGADLTRVFAVWEGGVAIFGALIGGAIGVFIAARMAGLRFLSVLDAIAPGMLVAQAFGRLGNYVNQELFGLPTDLPWGLQIDRPNSASPDGLPADTLFHPTFLYEILWNLAGVVIILLIESRVRRVDGRWSTERRPQWGWGATLGLYLIWYGMGRVWVESIRLDPSETFLGIRVNVWAALAAIVIGLLIILWQRRAHTGAEPSIYRPGREPESEATLDSEDTYGDVESSTDSVAAGGSATSGKRAT